MDRTEKRVSTIVRAVDSMWGRRRAVVHLVLGWLLVMGATACGEGFGDEPGATNTAGFADAPTTGAGDRVTVGEGSDRGTVTTSGAGETGTAVHHDTESGRVSHPPTTMMTTTTPILMEEAMAQEVAEESSYMMATAAVASDHGSAAPRETNFRDYRQSSFVPTTTDRTSTFSLDTDRTSFHLALNWARAGYRVDPDSVRAEEWINAFDYEYDYPRHADSFAIVTDLVRHPLDDRRHLARIAFQAPEFRDDRPLNVTLVLDASGSMREGNRVAIAREAAESIRRGLRRQDRIAVVHFTEDVIDRLTVEHQPPEDRRVRDSIGNLAPHGSTNVQAGLDEGVWLADRIRRERPDAHNYIILMSDGVANVDATDPFAILESAYDADSGNPLRLITIGVGISNYNDYLLEQLAQYGNGWYRYLSDTDQARSTFSRDSWLALSVPFADQTRAQVTWNDRVVDSWRMIGYENRVTSDESFVEDRKEFAEIPVGAATTVFYELELSDRTRRDPYRTVELADVDLRWVTPVSGLSNRQSAVVALRSDLEFHAADPLLQLGAVVALSSDRYAGLPYPDSDSGGVEHDLWALSDRLQPLESRLKGSDAYHDFAFVLDHILSSIPVGGSEGSGYSR